MLLGDDGEGLDGGGERRRDLYLVVVGIACAVLVVHVNDELPHRPPWLWGQRNDPLAWNTARTPLYVVLLDSILNCEHTDSTAKATQGGNHSRVQPSRSETHLLKDSVAVKEVLEAGNGGSADVAGTAGDGDTMGLLLVLNVLHIVGERATVHGHRQQLLASLRERAAVLQRELAENAQGNMVRQVENSWRQLDVIMAQIWLLDARLAAAEPSLPYKKGQAQETCNERKLCYVLDVGKGVVGAKRRCGPFPCHQ